MMIIGCDFHTRYQQIAERDLRQLLWHRHKLVRMRTMLGNQLHFLAMSQGLCRKKKLFTEHGRAELASPRLGPETPHILF